MTKAAPDWERIEAQYRTGTLTTRQIAAEHGISHTAINKRAKAHDWTRDLSAQVRAKADALVSRALVSTEVSSQAKATEKLTVEVEAQVQARIRIAHRTDIARNRELAATLLAELQAQTGERDLIEQMREALSEGEQSQTKDRLMEAWRRVMGLPGRADTLRKLAETLRIVVAMEREALGLDKADAGGAERQLGDLEIASKLAYFVELGRKRSAEQKPG